MLLIIILPDYPPTLGLGHGHDGFHSSYELKDAKAPQFHAKPSVPSDDQDENNTDTYLHEPLSQTHLTSTPGKKG